MQHSSLLRRLNTFYEDNQAKSSVTQPFNSFCMFSPMNNEITLVYWPICISYGHGIFFLLFDDI